MNKTSALKLLLSILISACSSIPTHNADYPMASVKGAIEAQLTMGIQKVTKNGREYLSRPFVVKQKEEAEFENFRERGRARVSIRGDERPYAIDVEVYIERAPVSKSNSNPLDDEYSKVEYDNQLAKKLLTNIIKRLEHNNTEKNAIDDFRAF